MAHLSGKKSRRFVFVAALIIALLAAINIGFSLTLVITSGQAQHESANPVLGKAIKLDNVRQRENKRNVLEPTETHKLAGMSRSAESIAAASTKKEVKLRAMPKSHNATLKIATPVFLASLSKSGK